MVKNCFAENPILQWISNSFNTRTLLARKMMMILMNLFEDQPCPKGSNFLVSKHSSLLPFLYSYGISYYILSTTKFAVLASCWRQRLLVNLYWFFHYLSSVKHGLVKPAITRNDGFVIPHNLDAHLNIIQSVSSISMDQSVSSISMVQLVSSITMDQQQEDKPRGNYIS